MRERDLSNASVTWDTGIWRLISQSSAVGLSMSLKLYGEPMYRPVKAVPFMISDGALHGVLPYLTPV